MEGLAPFRTKEETSKAQPVEKKEMVTLVGYSG
jgi:hypothetical protein